MNLPFIGFKAIEVIATFLFIGLIFYKINDRIKILNYIILLTTLTALFGMIQFHFSHTNSYSFSSMIGILLYIGGMKYKLLKLKEVWIGLLICILGIFFGTSSGSNVALVLGLLFLFGGGRKGINIIWISIVVVFSYLLYLYFENEIFNIIFPGKNIETIGGMTGRQDMWRMYWSGFLKKPVLGYGYCIGEKNSTIFGWNLDFGANTTAHNMFMSVLINTGLIGLILWVRFLFVLFNRTYKYATLGNKYAALLFPVLIAIVVNANTAPALGSEWSPTGTICYSVVVFALWGLQPIRMLKSWNVKRAKNFNDNIFSKKSIANINI
jgi:O-antigen ligase